MSSARAVPNYLVIIDSDFQLAAWLTNLLSEQGFEVRTAMDVPTAQRIIELRVPDLIIIDYLLPPMGGPAFLATLRQQFAQQLLPALVTLPMGQITPLLRDQLTIMDDFIVKPGSIPEFIERIQHAIHTFRDLPARVSELGRIATAYRSSGGYRRADISVLFTDVRGFTAFSENHDPETAAGILNTTFDIMARAVIEQGGIIDKFIGDAMMAIFGFGGHANAGHELAAVRAAEKFMTEVSRELGENLLVQDEPLTIGVGIHSGYALVGPIGAIIRRDITAIGDTVNLASRLCDEAGGGEIIISEELYQKVANAVMVTSEREVSLKGKRMPQRVYAIKPHSLPGP